jgi:succinate dehydrogenase/fumarate reductase flavoprotein subunit
MANLAFATALLRHRLQLLGSFLRSRDRLRQPHAVDRGTLPEVGIGTGVRHGSICRGPLAYVTLRGSGHRRKVGYDSQSDGLANRVKDGGMAVLDLIPRAEGAELDNGEFDETFDVVVVGYGFAGGVAAIEAADHKAKVLICEKMPLAGGLSICSGGAVRCATDAADAFAYLKASNAGKTPDEVLKVLADGMVNAKAYVEQLVACVEGAALKPTEFSGKGGGNYPYPGWQTFYHTQVDVPPTFDRAKHFPKVRTRPSSGGPGMFWVIDTNVRNRGIDVRVSAPVKRLIRTASNEVRGVVIGGPNGDRRIRTRRAVILACGGFEANEEMKRNYWEGTPVLIASCRGNTGDGIRMAQAVGADLWHMWHFHGCYAFKHPDTDFPFALRVKRLPDWNPAKKNEADVKMVWIIVDQRGRRYMNECPPYCQDTSHRPMHFMDSETMSHPRIPSYLITDERGRKTYQLADVRTNDHQYAYDWSEDNTKELELKILRRANSIEQLAAEIEVDPLALKSSIERWNALCDRGVDEDYGRPAGTMMKIDQPPYVFGQVWPTVSNTHGGPVHNANQQIIDIAGQPIPRLYAAGELGSSFGHLYLSGGNIAECFVTGWVAGREAAVLEPWG